VGPLATRAGCAAGCATCGTQWDGLKVHPSWYEEKHPQLEPRRDVSDPQALREPRPDATEPTAYITPLTDLYPDTAGGNGP
jgi:hypothetical protein